MKTQQGFTAIELIIAIAAESVLIAVVVGVAAYKLTVAFW